MDPLKNPYSPGAGTRPRELAGREREIERALNLFRRVKAGQPEKSMFIVGLRGVGKTVLLNMFSELAEQQSFRTAHIEASDESTFAASMARAMRRILLGMSATAKAKRHLQRALSVLKAFTIRIPGGPDISLDVEALVGMADSGDLSDDLADLFVESGKAADAHGAAIAIFLDEVQYFSKEELAALIVAMHRVSQLRLPVTIVGAGLPQLPALAGEAKSYAERLFDFPRIGSLDRAAAARAITVPAEELGVRYSAGAVELIVRLTEGYPYFLQEYGKFVWNIATRSPVNVTDVKRAQPLVQNQLDESFFRVRVDRATAAERRYMRAMAELGKGPYRSGEIADVLGVKVTSVGPTRAQLISKGFVYSPGHGLCDFTVPQFDDYMRRNYSLR